MDGPQDGTGEFKATGHALAAMFHRGKLGEKGEPCPKCGTEKVYFVQHAHGNYPILDYVCPNCDLGGEYQVDWDKGGEKVKDE